MPNRRVEIPKGNGKVRTLQIPCIRDRVVQGALKLILEAVFEADFCPNSYGFRPKRSPHRALAEVRRSVMRRMSTVIDVDLSRYFDTIRHSVLLDKIAKRIQDPQVMHLVKQIIKVGGKVGVPQGGPFSPLAANISKIRDIIARGGATPAAELVKRINATLAGWVNYFRAGNSSRAFSEVRDYVEMKVRTLLTRRKRRRKLSVGWRRWSNESLSHFLPFWLDSPTDLWPGRAAVGVGALLWARMPRKRLIRPPWCALRPVLQISRVEVFLRRPRNLRRLGEGRFFASRAGLSATTDCEPVPPRPPAAPDSRSPSPAAVRPETRS